MKVKELVEKLQKMPQDRIVLFDAGYRSPYGSVVFLTVDDVGAGVNELDGAIILDTDMDVTAEVVI